MKKEYLCTFNNSGTNKYNILKANKILLSVALAVLAITIAVPSVKAQNNVGGGEKPLIGTFRLEARADFEYSKVRTETSTPLSGSLLTNIDDNYGFHGRYFNLHMGGNLGDKFTYYFRQRIKAEPGSIRFFDNTDFLWLDYRASKNWSLRFGKDALAVGGFDYDAAPIDVFLQGYYWNMFYCFQLAASGAWTSNDGSHTLRAQVASSPFSYTGSAYGEANLLSYNLLWNGKVGHWQTLYSLNAFQRTEYEVKDGSSHFMGYVVLGNQLSYDGWSAYVDLISHFDGNNFGGSYAAIGKLVADLGADWQLFVKAAYTRSEYTPWDNNYRDCLSLPNQTEIYGGIGCLFRPASCKDVRLHAFAAYFSNQYDQKTGPAVATVTESYPCINVGATWNINVIKAWKQRKNIF